MNGTKCLSYQRYPAIKALLSIAISMSAPIWHTACARSSRPFRHEEKAKLMKNLLKDFITDESGATAIEYGLIAAGISLAIIAIVNGLGTRLNTKFTAINNSLK
jgi:pilus assembly protein Flp/PilA